MVEFDPVLVGLVLLLVGFFFFVYLFLRRIATGFREGLESAQDD